MLMLRLRLMLRHQLGINRNAGSKPKSVLDQRAETSACVKAGDKSNGCERRYLG